MACGPMNQIMWFPMGPSGGHIYLVILIDFIVFIDRAPCLAGDWAHGRKNAPKARVLQLHYSHDAPPTPVPLGGSRSYLAGLGHSSAKVPFFFAAQFVGVIFTHLIPDTV